MHSEYRMQDYLFHYMEPSGQFANKPRHWSCCGNVSDIFNNTSLEVRYIYLICFSGLCLSGIGVDVNTCNPD